MSESLQEAFDRARVLAAPERARFLHELEDSDPAVAARLRALLAAAEGGSSPLDANPWTQELDEPAEVETPLPERIGPYRVLSELGRGGMGRVYLALHEGEDFSRRLAVKVIAPGGAGADIERRFREERRILAALEHPGIARFHDAGRDAGGRWFLALEYVEGANLIEHALATSLSIDDRLRLFREVLEAVAHAHARGVVHRDLKPANILVGGDGHPRLLDFGIAKLLEAGDSASSAETRTALRAFTPAYASPEQFRGDPVTPASDVFSLGVLLYELVAGVRPFGKASGAAASGGEHHPQAALERQILDTDPEPPSTASRHTAPAPGAARTLPGKQPHLSRDLDAVCLKALRKSPGDRYSSAAELAEEIDHLLAGEAVAARADDRRYRFARYLTRHRATLAVGGALAVAAVAVGLAISASRRAEPVAPSAEPAARIFPLSGISGRDAAELEAAFAAAPASVETGARLAIALEQSGRYDEAELVVTRLRQIPGHAEDPLVDYVEATTAMSASESQRALVLFTAALERALASGRGELIAQIRASRGRLFHTMGRRDEGLADMEAARRDFAAAGDHASLSRVLNDLAIDRLEHGHFAAGEELLERALAEGRAAGGGGAGTITTNLALVALHRGFPDRSETRFREVIDAFRASRSRRLGFALFGLAEALTDLGRSAEAAAALDEAIEQLTGAPSERDLAYAYRIRGAAQMENGDLAGAATTAKHLEALAKRLGDRSPLAFSNRLRGAVAAAKGDLPEARRRLEDARRLFVENSEADWAREATLARAAIEHDFGESEAAREAAETVLPANAPAIEITTEFLAEALRLRLDLESGQRKEAARRLERLVAAGAGTTSERRAIALLGARAAVAGAEGRHDEARSALETAISRAKRARFHVTALELELEAARLARARGDRSAARASALAVEKEAARLELLALAGRARELASTPG